MGEKTLGENCTVVDLSDKMMMAVELHIDDRTILLVNIYMPYEAAEREEEFV